MASGLSYLDGGEAYLYLGGPFHLYYSDEEDTCEECGTAVRDCACDPWGTQYDNSPYGRPQRNRRRHGAGRNGGGARHGASPREPSHHPAVNERALPEVCRNHQQRTCPGNCGRLHICRLFLADICKFGSSCCHGHSVTTRHNTMVCEDYGLDTRMELDTVRRLSEAFQNSGVVSDDFYHRQLEWCSKFGSGQPCEEFVCNRIHLCRRYIENRCRFNGDTCQWGHRLRTGHNQQVLQRHRVEQMSNRQVLELLYNTIDKVGPVPQYVEPAPAADYRPPSHRQRKRQHGHQQHNQHPQEMEFMDQARDLRGWQQPQQPQPAPAPTPRPYRLPTDLIRIQSAVGSLLSGLPPPPAAQPAPARQQQQQPETRPRPDLRQHFMGPVCEALPDPAAAAAALASEGGTRTPPGELAEELQCAVCLGTLERATTLGCGHSFCAKCVDDVRRVDPKCPVCRVHIVTFTRSVVLDNIISSVTGKR